MKKIGIITFHKAHNYGASLQAYALKTILEREGNSVEFIDYFPEMMQKQYNVMKINKKNIFTMIKSFISSIVYFNKNKKRYNNFNTFINKNFNLTNKYDSIEAIKKNPPQEDVYITGSDQVWNPDITKGLSDVYTLNFGKNDITRISYAASIGKKTLGNEPYGEKISKIDYISVREETAKNLLQPIINKPINVVLDPTLLIDHNEWEKKFNLQNREKEPYILAYRVEENAEYLKIVNELSKNTGIKVINFEKRQKKYDNFMRSAYEDGPEEFVRLIRNAEYIVTTSFHATVFSILFHKNFFIVPHKTTGSRVIDLLNKLNIKKRVYFSLKEFKESNYKNIINYTDVDRILYKEREKSLEFLRKALNTSKDDENE